MPWLTDADCKYKYPTVDPVNAVCAGVEGGNKDTCQVKINTLNHALYEICINSI